MINFSYIDACVFEATVNVFDAMQTYRGKQCLIEDARKNTWVSESIIESIDKDNDQIIMESVTEESKSTDDARYKAFRYDIMKHSDGIAKANRKVAAYLVAAYDGSQSAKQSEGKTGATPITDLLIGRDSGFIKELSKKLYAGKHESIYRMIQMLNTPAAQANAFVKLTGISKLGETPGKDGKIQNSLMAVNFSCIVPKKLMDRTIYDICMNGVEIHKLYNEQKEIKQMKRDGIGSDEYLNKKLEENCSKIVELKEPYKTIFDFSNDNIKKLLAMTCYSKNNKESITLDIAFHLLHKNSDTDGNEVDYVGEINKMKFSETINSNIVPEDPKNQHKIIYIAKQFGFIKFDEDDKNPSVSYYYKSQQT